jgi:hypothetical protein
MYCTAHMNTYLKHVLYCTYDYLTKTCTVTHFPWDGFGLAPPLPRSRLSFHVLTRGQPAPAAQKEYLKGQLPESFNFLNVCQN